MTGSSSDALQLGPSEAQQRLVLLHGWGADADDLLDLGALLVGRICNHDGAGAFTRGAEKGCFYYGGSTVVLLLQKGRATVDERFFAATRRGEETRVLLGQRLDCLP